MIIYGHNSTHLGSEKSQNAVCPTCESKGSMLNTVFSRYVHIFWIPVFPFGKKGAAICEECGTEVKPKKMDEDLRRDYDMLKSITRTPIWHFAGAALILLGVGYLFINDAATKKKEITYINEPMEGDTYRYKTNMSNYSVMRVASFDDDSVYMYYNGYETNKRSGISDIDIDENYDTVAYGITRSMLLELHNDKVIYDIDR